MSFSFIVILVFAFIGAAILAFSMSYQTGEQPTPEEEPSYSARDRYKEALKDWSERNGVKTGTRRIGSILVICALVLTAFSSFTIVGTNKIGILTSFAKPVDAVDNGFTAHEPWVKVVEFDASRQYLRFQGKGNDKDADDDKKEWATIPVKMEGEAKANVTVVVAWQMKASTAEQKKQAIDLYRNYKTFARLTENYVAANARSAAQKTYDRINPLVTGKNPTFAAISDTMLNEMKGLVGSEIEIISVQVTDADYDDKTDESIKAMQSEFAKTTLAEQQKITNQKVSEANAALVNALNDLILKDACIKGNTAAGLNSGSCLQPGWGGTAPAPQQDK